MATATAVRTTTDISKPTELAKDQSNSQSNVFHPNTANLSFTFDPYLRKEYRYGMDPSM